MTAARLLARGLERMSDLLALVPRAYDDFRRVYPLSALADLPEGTPVVVRGRVRSVHVFPRRLLDVHLEEDGAGLRARWFRPPTGMARSFPKGSELMLAGALRRTEDGAAELVHPLNMNGRPMGIRPRYPKIEGVPGRTVEKLMTAALDRCAARALDPLPEDVRRRLGLPSLSEALLQLHRPDAGIDERTLCALQECRSPAHRRLAFEDLLLAQLGLRLDRERARAAPGRASMAPAAAVVAAVRTALPFPLTRAQERAIDTVLADLASPRPMQRLLQGDVGSGKTAVAFAATVLVARSGGQALLMAPTEILAEQHARALSSVGEKLGLRVGLLTGGLARARQEEIVAEAAAGRLDVVVGTHALLGGRVRCPRLGLVIIDEQQRFGVKQRARFRGAASPGSTVPGILPHLLVLSATPIPRTLALTMYGDLDLTTLDELPPGRQPVATTVCAGSGARANAYAAAALAVARGEQVLIVCPAVTGGKDGPVTVTRHIRDLARTGALGKARIGFVHGQLDGAKQEQVLRSFRDGALDVLVATTVIEVGLDIPRASVMVVEDADRFGLAQLHQLRGRVGRGTVPGTCWLCTRSDAGAVHARLAALAATTDGFRVAEEDLRQRGPGDIFGWRQSGSPRFAAADFAGYAALIEPAREEAERLLADDARLARPEHEPLRAVVEKRWERGQAFAEEAG